MHANRKNFAAALSRRVCDVGQTEATSVSLPPLLRAARIRGIAGVDIRISMSPWPAHPVRMLLRRELLLFSDLLELLASSSSSAGGRDSAISAVRVQGKPSMAMLAGHRDSSDGRGPTPAADLLRVSCPLSLLSIVFIRSLELHDFDRRPPPLGHVSFDKRFDCSTSTEHRTELYLRNGE